MPANGLDELLDAVGLANKKIAERSQTVQNLQAQQQQAAEQQQQSLETQKNSSAVVTKAAGVAQMDAEAKTKRFATDLGANPDDSAAIMGTLATSWKESAIAADRRLKKLDDGMQISFLEHPIDFIAAKITFESDVKNAEMAEKKRDSAKQSLMEAQQLTQGAAVTHNALKATVTEATLQATLDEAAAAITGKQAGLKIQNAGIQMDDLRTLTTMDTATINNLGTALSAKAQAVQQANAAAHLKLAQQSADQQLKEFNQRVADKKESKEDIKGIADTVRIGAKAAGIEGVTAMSDSKIIQMLNMKADGFQDFLKSGIKTQAMGKPIVSENLGETARIIATSGAPMRPEQGTVRTLLNQAWQTAGSVDHARIGGYDNTKVDQVTAAAGKYVATQAAKMKANIDPRDGTNIYAAPPLASVVELPAIKGSAFYRAVLDKQMEAGGLKEFNSEQLTAMTADAINKKQITFNEAAVGLQAMHAGAARINNATKNYAGLGLPLQDSFKTQFPAAVGFSANKTYDMSSAQDINRALMAKLSAGQLQTIYTNDPFKN